jgi:phenylpyruvate tautomerase PptA (4-oxalocrotonate tautomerase family)
MLTPNQTALRAAENMRNLKTPAEKRELAHELCRYLVAILGKKERGH